VINPPKPTVLARNLRQLADRLDDEGDRALYRAPILAARGWPASTNGTDGGRTADPTSSTERAALNPGPFDGIDYRMRAQMSNLWAGIVFLHATLDTVMTHASDDDPIPAGTGPCQVVGCEHVCNPRKNPNDRLKAGYCPKHWRRWLRQGRPERGWFERYTETEDVA
jgi:hypothetical protein